MKRVDNAIIRFSGDSGDGMQLVGGQFSSTSALMGNDFATFPDFPAEIRAPAGTVLGVSGFQVNIGSVPIYTPGDRPDILVAMNAAALKANLTALKKGGVIIVNTDAFDENNLKKAGYTTNPLDGEEIKVYHLIKAPISAQTLEALKDFSLTSKEKLRCKNFYALGIIYFMYGRDLTHTISWLEKMFAKKPMLAEANIKVLRAGHSFGDMLEAAVSTYEIPKATITPGIYRHINGNTALAWGLLQAVESAGLELFFGSYPITPASDILHELAKRKAMGVKTFQAEDEIAAICAAIGASFAGGLGITSTSGPGLALKTEAAGLACMLEIPLVILDIQRGGPSTGLPTKTEQSDLNMAMYGRNGECPLIILAPQSPSDCFAIAFEAARLSLETMTPVILLSDGYIANGAEPWKIPDLASFPKIKTRKIVAAETEGASSLDPAPATAPFLPYQRDEQTLARSWAVPGLANYEHRIGGLEKEVNTGGISYDPVNHQKMINLRAQKVKNVERLIPEQELDGEASGDLLVISWGGTYGATYSAVKSLQDEGQKVSLMHLRYLNPFPRNVDSILKKFKTILVCELNSGQLNGLLRTRFSCPTLSYNKVQGLPFYISELTQVLHHVLKWDKTPDSLELEALTNQKSPSPLPTEGEAGRMKS